MIQPDGTCGMSFKSVTCPLGFRPLPNGRCCPPGAFCTGCQPGEAGVWPNCHKPCPPGEVGTPPHCYPKLIAVPLSCAAGEVPRDGRCVIVPCAQGMSRIDGVCKKGGGGGTCPAGTIGKPPHCLPAKILVPGTCPAGSYGRPPHCRPIKITVKSCPAGTFGRPPHCRRIVHGPEKSLLKWKPRTYRGLHRTGGYKGRPAHLRLQTGYGAHVTHTHDHRKRR
jgi:hypothetical protein